MNDLCSVSNAFFTFDIIHGAKGQMLKRPSLKVEEENHE
jgi:hypothetical protein